MLAMEQKRVTHAPVLDTEGWVNEVALVPCLVAGAGATPPWKL